MQPSKRVQSLTVSPIRKLVPYAQAAEAKGKKVYHLNIGQPDLPTPSTFMEKIAQFHSSTISYGNSQGDLNLIKAIQRYYQKWHINYDINNIYITNGASEALAFTILSLCDPGDEIIVFEPFYPNYNSIAKTYNVNLRAVTTSPEKGYHLPNMEEIEKVITPKTKAILLTNPGNPTGVIYSHEEMDMISHIVCKYDLGLIADEVYREYVFSGKFESFGTRKELEQNLIITDSVSKRYSACGVRIGCLLSKNKTFCKEFMKCCQSRLCCPTIEQFGAAALYDTPETYLLESKVEYQKRCETIKTELSLIPGLKTSSPNGAFYVMVKLPVDDSEKFAIWLLNNFDINGETVMIAPGGGFYITPDKGKDEARLAYVINCTNLKKAINLLGAGLKAYPGYTLKK